MSVSTTTLDSVCDVLNGFAFKSEEYVTSGIRIIRITNVQKGQIQDDDPKFIAADRADEFSRFLLSEGDILISLTGNVGRVGVLTKALLPAALNQRVGALKLRSEKIDPRYLFHFLNSEAFERDAIKNSKGVAQLNLSSKWIEKREIPLPPLAEQKRIAGILDTADALRAKRREALAQLDSLLQATFLDLFGDPVTNPKGWNVAKLDDLAATKPNNGVFRKNFEYAVNGDGVPVVWVEELFRGTRIDIGESRRLEATRGEIEKYGLRHGDVLFCRSSLKLDGIAFNNVFLGKSGEAIFECHLIRISPNVEVVSPMFLNIQLRTNAMRAVLKAKSKTATMTTIDQKALGSVAVIVPPVQNQRRFAEVAESIEQQKVAHRAHLTELDALFASLQSRAFRGEL